MKKFLALMILPLALNATSLFDQVKQNGKPEVAICMSADSSGNYLDPTSSNSSVIDDFELLPTTVCTSVINSSYHKLTIASSSYIYLSNENSVAYYVVFTNSATAPLNTLTVHVVVPPGGISFSVNKGLTIGFNYMHWFMPLSSFFTITPTAHAN